MEESAIVKPCLSEGLEVFDVAGSLVFKKFQFNITEFGFDDCNLFRQHRPGASQQYRNPKQNNDLSHGTPKKMI